MIHKMNAGLQLKENESIPKNIRNQLFIEKGTVRELLIPRIQHTYQQQMTQIHTAQFVKTRVIYS